MTGRYGDKPECTNTKTRIVSATENSGKNYSFAGDHDPDQPADIWFQESSDGLVLFVVFYTLACRWSLCTACNLPSASSLERLCYRNVIRQIDNLFESDLVNPRKNEIRKIIISNNGSVLDEETFPSTALMHLMARINLDLPALQVVTLETRPEYVDLTEIDFLSRAMKERDNEAEIELAIGFEAYDEHIRNEVFRKGLSLSVFEKLVEAVVGHNVRIKCYFMQKPVTGMTDEAAVRDVESGIDYLSSLAFQYGVAINMHLNPTFVARGTILEKSFITGEYQPPCLKDVVRAVLHSRGKPVSVFVGLNDEGLAVENGSFIRPGDESVVAQLESFNRTQDYDALKRFSDQYEW